MEDVYDITWDIKAGEDLDRIFNYLVETASEEVARKVKKAIVTAVGQLRTQPERYPSDPLLRSQTENFRYIRLWQYKIIYEFTDKKLSLPESFILGKTLRRLTRTFKFTTTHE